MVLKRYARYYNQARRKLSLRKNSPVPHKQQSLGCMSHTHTSAGCITNVKI
ncbi:IS3 family transposase [Hyphococcus flavus]|uniref:IS3 family transposase n=1 Tax=Hyphococcus flavus TaxID=1866326 RepID=UPI003B75C771